MPSHPPCGLYRTTRALNDLPAGLLVRFHDHGDPGPGVYLPKAWNLNRAEWHEHGHTVPDADWSSSLAPLPEEGLYRVKAPFFCCDRQCARFEPGQLVQLGYDGKATPLLFVPEWTSKGLGFPEKGTRLDDARLAQLEPLLVARAADAPKGLLLH
jgi:hypothetical protein